MSRGMSLALVPLVIFVRTGGDGRLWAPSEGRTIHVRVLRPLRECAVEPVFCSSSITSSESRLLLGVRLTLGRSLHSAERKGHYTLKKTLNPKPRPRTLNPRPGPPDLKKSQPQA